MTNKSNTNAPQRKSKPRHALRVVKGGFEPADPTSAAAMRSTMRVGDLVFVQFTKPRNPGFHRLAHQLGGMLAENLDAFAGMDPHRVLKRLQIEARVGCDEMAIIVPGVGKCLHLIPRSLSYESMDETEFRQVIAAMCDYVSRQYWPTCTPEKIEAMASVWVEAA